MKTLMWTLAVLCPALTASTATFTVINTNDAGAGSLRQAILDSNGTAATNAIGFNIPGSGVHVIKLLSALPSMTRAVAIDGFTQPGASANTLFNGNNANWLIELDGETAGPNGSGLRLGATHSLVRGLRISNFSGYGIGVSDNGVVAGCFVYRNQLGGVQIDEDDSIRIGGTAPADRNVISGNFGPGIVLGEDCELNQLIGNFIGTDVSGTGDFGNQGWGIHLIDHNEDTQIGGVLLGEGNVIAFNGSGGVRVESFRGENNSIRGNRIFSNGGLAIDLGFIPGVTVNDSGDTDMLQNFPLITNAVIGLTTATIQGSLNSRSNTQFALDFYANTECDASGYGEGEVYLGNASVTTDANGNASFQVVVPATLQARFLTATATDPFGNTSELSPCQLATVSGSTFTVVNTNDSGPGSLRQAIVDSNATNSGTNRIIFYIPGSGLQVIRLQSALPAITESVTIDGFTQPGATANTSSTSNNANWLIEINGASAGDDQNGFETHVAKIIVRGLRIAHFRGFGIEGFGDGGSVSGCFICSNRWGVRIPGSEGAQVGGVAPADRNVISANQDIGVVLDDGGKTNHVIGNFIGTDTTGTTNLGTQSWGVVIKEGTWGSTIGEPHSGANTIAYNSAGGVQVVDGTNNSILGNRIFSNGGPGIVLGPSGAGPNDVGDADVGANQLQNFPIITNAIFGFRTVVQGRLNSQPNMPYELDFYGNTHCDISGYGEGETYLGGWRVVTDSNGDVNFEALLTTRLQGRYLTATATDPFGNTSEFSPCQFAEARPTTNTVVNTNDSGPGSLRQALFDADQDEATNIIVFNIPGNGLQVIRLLSLLSVTEPAIIDGFTQPGASANTIADGNNANWQIELDGSFLDNFSYGLSLSRNVAVRGLRISNSPGHGVRVHENCVIAGCFIYSNHFGGIAFDDDAENVLIGGPAPADRNVISGNFGPGISLDGGPSHRVLGNWIGTDLAGTGRLGNQGWGILLQTGVVGGRFGGINTGEANIIAFNSSGGVKVEFSHNNSIRGNRIFSNGGLGIDLDFLPGVSANDLGDGDVGANQLQNFPLITNVIVHQTTTTVQGRLNSHSNTQYVIDFYRSSERDVSLHGEGEDYLGSASVTTDGNGDASFAVTFPAQYPSYLTATATDPLGNTSEFSPSWPPPLRLDFAQLPGQSHELVIRNVDGSPILSDRLTGLYLLTSADLLSWGPIPNSLELTNGVIRVRGLELTNGVRFFRSVEGIFPPTF